MTGARLLTRYSGEAANKELYDYDFKSKHSIAF